MRSIIISCIPLFLSCNREQGMFCMSHLKSNGSSLRVLAFRQCVFPLLCVATLRQSSYHVSYFRNQGIHASEPGQSCTITGISLLIVYPGLHAPLTVSLSPLVVFIQMDKSTLPLATSRLCFSFFLHLATVSLC